MWRKDGRLLRQIGYVLCGTIPTSLAPFPRPHVRLIQLTYIWAYIFTCSENAQPLPHLELVRKSPGRHKQRDMLPWTLISSMKLFKSAGLPIMEQGKKGKEREEINKKRQTIWWLKCTGQSVDAHWSNFKIEKLDWQP